MLTYLKEILGIAADERPWAEAGRLPLYLRSGRKYSVLQLDGAELLVIHMEQDAFNLPAFRKQLVKLEEYWKGEIVLCFSQLTSYQRKTLITQGISFVVPGSQLYLPCLGMAFQERMPNKKMRGEHLPPIAQLLFLYLLYQDTNIARSKTELAQRLDVSPMQITRACQDLETMGLVQCERKGRSNYISPMLRGKAFYEQAKSYLISPVQKRVFVKGQDVFRRFPLSGESALAEKTMLNPPGIPCRAVDKKVYKQLVGVETVDPAWCDRSDLVELELWKYDPQKLTQDGIVDVVSLAHSFADKNDERIEMAVDELLEEHKW